MDNIFDEQKGNEEQEPKVNDVETPPNEGAQEEEDEKPIDTARFGRRVSLAGDGLGYMGIQLRVLNAWGHEDGEAVAARIQFINPHTAFKVETSVSLEKPLLDWLSKRETPYLSIMGTPAKYIEAQARPVSQGVLGTGVWIQVKGPELNRIFGTGFGIMDPALHRELSRAMGVAMPLGHFDMDETIIPQTEGEQK